MLSQFFAIALMEAASTYMCIKRLSALAPWVIFALFKNPKTHIKTQNFYLYQETLTLPADYAIPKHWPNCFRMWHCTTMKGGILSVFKQGIVFQSPARMNRAAETTALCRGKGAATIKGSLLCRGPAVNHSIPRCYQQSSYIQASKCSPPSPKLKDLQKLKHQFRSGIHL